MVHLGYGDFFCSHSHSNLHRISPVIQQVKNNCEGPVKSEDMKKSNYIIKSLVTGLISIGLLVSCKKDKDNSNDVVVIQANGDITAELNEFRQLLGSTLNEAPGAQGGRREVNWDGIPDSLLGKPLPQDFFNPVGNDPALAVRQKGLVYQSTGNFMVSNSGFAEINSQAAGQFNAFSGKITFANVNNELWDIAPEIPGEATAATVKGFGIVFSDVDKAHSTFIEFFGEKGSLGKFFVPARDNNSSFSFLGVYFKNERIRRIRVGHDGTLASGGKDISNGGTHDLVVLDDFLYDEPVRLQ